MMESSKLIGRHKQKQHSLLLHTAWFIPRYHTNTHLECYT